MCRNAERGRGSATVGDRVSGSARRRHKSRSRSRERGRASGSPYSRGTDTEDGEVKEPSSPVKAGPLSARQQARLADLSLLLEVILKTDYARYAINCLSCDACCRDSQQGLWLASWCGSAVCFIYVGLNALFVMCMAAVSHGNKHGAKDHQYKHSKHNHKSHETSKQAFPQATCRLLQRKDISHATMPSFVKMFSYLGLEKQVFLFVDMQGSRGVCEVGNVAAAAHHADPLHRAPHHLIRCGHSEDARSGQSPAIHSRRSAPYA